MPPPPAPQLAPSACHLRVMQRLRPALAYDGGDVAAWRRRLRPKVWELLGMDQIPGLGGAARRPAMKVRSLSTFEHELGTIEKVRFPAEPGADVLAYVCIPRGARPPYPFMICLQGHSTGMHVSIGRALADEARPIETQGDRDFAIGCMRRGVAALCVEQRSFGERGERLQKQRAEHPCHDAVMHALMLGRTLLGERVFDVDRGIDYLAWRGDADMARVGVMGNSGGGTTTTFAAALLDRVTFAIPSCAFCAFAAGLMRIYHCGDNYVPSLLRYAEMADVLGLFAPRPVVVVAGRRDDIFPIAGVRAAFRELKRIYAAAGAAGACRLVVGEEGHRFYAEQAWRVALPMFLGEPRGAKPAPRRRGGSRLAVHSRA